MSVIRMEGNHCCLEYNDLQCLKEFRIFSVLSTQICPDVVFSVFKLGFFRALFNASQCLLSRWQAVSDVLAWVNTEEMCIDMIIAIDAYVTKVESVIDN